MKIVVLANEDLKMELLEQGIQEPASIEWFYDIHEIHNRTADVCIDLLFPINGQDRVNILQQLPVNLVIVNDVIGVSANLPSSFVRINGWPGFLKRPVTEASTSNEKNKIQAAAVFNCLNKKIEWTKDKPGFITARIVSTIINEAYFALDQAVSTKAEIDIAMKMGTNYPYGPFEWCNLIGIEKVYSLLKVLSQSDTRYQPSELLKTEVIF